MTPFEFSDPGAADLCLREVVALEQLGLRDLAEARLWDAVARSPELPEVAFALLEAAAAAGDRARTERLAAANLLRYRPLRDAWVYAQRALRQVGALEAAARVGDEAALLFADDIGVLAERANTAEAAWDLPGLLRACALVRAIAPLDGDTLTIEMRGCRAMGDVARVDALVREVLAAGVEAPGVLVEVMHAAVRWEDDALLFATSGRLIATAPEAADAYVAPLYRLLQQRAYGEAELLLARVPAELAEVVEIERVAVYLLNGMGRVAEAYARVVAATARHPGDAELHGLRALLTQLTGDEAELEAFVNAAYPRFPDEARLMTEYAAIPERHGDLAEALARWRGFRDRAPERGEADGHVVRLLTLLDRLEEAEAEASAALARFADDRLLLLQHALVAQLRLDWDEAERRWAVFAARYPEDADAREWIAQARAVRALARLDAGEGEAAAEPGAPMAALFMRFESLGADCEFGLVQRHFGAEPLGLLRWASPALDDLCRMLEDGLEGVGEAENMLLRVEPGGEYTTGDVRYFAGHTFVSAAATPEAQMLRSMTRRLRFLRDKLLADLAEGEKVFVYLGGTEALTRPMMQRLYRAIRRYGGGRLFCVRKGPAVTRPGAVLRLDEGLFVGELSAPADEGHAPKRHAPVLAAMCEAVLEMAFPAG